GRDSVTTEPRSRMLAALRRWLEQGLLVVSLGLLTGGGLAWALGSDRWADALWGTATVVAVVPAAGWVVGALLRRQLGVDQIAVGPAVLDESALTGEPELVERAAGDPVRSGTLNAGSAFEVRCTVPAAQSTYAGIIALVQQAGAENAPVIRLADRFAAWFLP